MANGQVGRLSVRVLPDTTQFRRDLKKALDRAEKQVKATIDTELRISKQSLAAAKRQLEGLQARIPATVDTDRIRESARKAQETAQRATERNPVKVPAQMGDLDRKFISRLRAQAEKAAASVEAQIPATIDGEGMRGKLQAQLKRLERQMQATIPVEPEKAAAWRTELNRMVDDINDQKAQIEANVDLDHGVASAQVAAFTRPRFLPVNISINKASLAAAASAVAALSGARVLGNFGRSIKNALSNLDRALPGLAAGATAIASLGAAALAGTSNLFALGASLASIAPAALVLPGIFAGFGVGLGVMVAALADAGTVLKDLGPKFSALQDTISSNFWSRAEGPIRDLAEGALPILRDRLGEVGSELGGFFGSMANSLNTPTNLGFINGILVNVRDSIDVASEGIANFTDGLLNLTNAGSTYLEPLASAFNRMSERFNEWVQVNTDNGQIFEWIDSGISALQDFGRVLGATGGILGGFATAAANAGGANLGALADGLENVNKAVNGPAFQGALTTVFQGAHDAMKALGPGVSALGDAFVSFAPTLAEILVLAGEIGSVGLGAIASAFENPAFQGGLTDFFEGVLTGVEAIAPHIPALAAAFGSVASFAGTLAAVIGPVLGAAIGALAPVVTDLMTGLSVIAPILGGVLVSAIEAIAPLIQNVVGAIVDWVTQNPEFASGLLVAAGAIGGLVLGAVSLISALAPVVGSIISIVAGLAGMGVSFGAVASAIGAFLGPVLAIVAGIAALAGMFVYAWTQSAVFREAVMGLVAAVWGAMQPIIAFITGTVVPVVMQVAGAFIGMVQTILDALIPFWTVMLQIWTEIITIMTPVIAFILDVFAPIFTHLGTIISAAFTFIGTVISAAINIITAIMQVFLAVIQGDWSGAWAAIQNVGVVIWESIKAIIGAAIQFVVTVIQSWLATAQSVWNTVWGAISAFVSSVWSAIVSAVSGFIAGLVARIIAFVASVKSNITNGFNAAKAAAVNAFQTLVARITGFISNLIARIVSFVGSVKSNIQNGFNTAKQMAVDAFQRLVTGVAEKISTLISDVKAIPGKITSGLGNLGSLLFSAGQDVIRGLIDGIKNMAGSAVDAAKGVASDAVNGAKALLGIASPSKVFAEIGKFTVQGLVQGLTGNAKQASSAAGNLAKGIITEFEKRSKAGKSSTVNSLSDRLTSLRKQATDLRKQAKATTTVFKRIGTYKNGKSRTKSIKVQTATAVAAEKKLASVQKQINATQASLTAARRGDTSGSAKSSAEAFFARYAQASVQNLQVLARTRDQLTAQIKSANSELADVMKERNSYFEETKSSLLGTYKIGDSAAYSSITDITSGFKTAASTVAVFGKTVSALRNRGLSVELIDQIAQLGPKTGTKVAKNLLGATGKELHALNASYASLLTSSLKTGRGLADSMYSAGIDAARGLVKGLTSQLSKVSSAAEAMAKKLTSTVRSALQIHSPSKVFAQIGAYTGQGMIVGLDSTARDVGAAMSRLVEPPSAKSLGAGTSSPAARQASEYKFEVHGVNEESVAQRLMSMVEIRERAQAIVL